MTNSLPVAPPGTRTERAVGAKTRSSKPMPCGASVTVWGPGVSVGVGVGEGVSVGVGVLVGALGLVLALVVVLVVVLE